MGAKESRIGFLSYDEALRRVTDIELKRLKDAFKRTCGLSYYMTQQCFIREVLGDGVPPKVAEVIYCSFGGISKGLHFNNLIVGLVLLTRGREEEKAKYIFSLFSNESGSYVVREEMEKMLHVVDGKVPESLKKCFSEGEKVNYEKFRVWLLHNKDAFTFSRWLLSGGVYVTLTDDSDTPTFYQTLAGVTHLEESDIIDLEKRYWLLKAQSRTGRFDLETFAPLVSPPIHPSLSEGLFNAFDENRDNHIDFKEISCGLSACCRGPLAERQKFCFKVFDIDRDGVLSRTELKEMVVALLEVWKDNRTDKIPELNMDLSEIVEDILNMHDTTKLGHLTLEDYQIWSVKSALANEFLNLLFQVCHIVLGLRPATPEEEGQIIRGWLERESRYGLQPGHSWFLIAMPWWHQWKEYVKYDANPVVIEPSSVLSGGKNSLIAAAANTSEQGEDKMGGLNYFSATEEKFSDNISTASEASETTSSNTLYPGTPGTDVCFARQHNTSDNNNQCFLGTNGSTLLQLNPQKPGAIDNQPLVTQEPVKAASLTMEGGRLKRSPQLIEGKDYIMVPEPVWRALYHWYGANLSLPRPVIKNSKTNVPELELFPRYLLFLRQQPATRTQQSNIWVNMGNVPSPNAPLKRVLAYTGCFSRMQTIKEIHEYLSQRLRIKEEDMRLWLYNSENYLTLLDDEDHRLEYLKIQDEQHLVIEVRNKDMSWPEEMSFIANSSKIDRHKVPTEKGATGLSNLGNTCFMNSSIQCVSNTQPLTRYFISGRHLYELNRTNPIGMKGHMAKCYGDLVQELWSGTQKNIAPLKLRWTIAKYAPRFNGFQQQDSQELLAFLLDGLHEDLNRVHDKPYVELKDSDGRPDWEVAAEAWENHLRRNRSIVVDLFHGQLKSQVKCKTCGHISVRFDPFNFLSLPLPMDSYMHLEITVIKLDGTTPVRYGLRLNMDEKYTGLKKQLSELCGLKPEQILLAEVHSSNIKNFPQDNQKVRLSVSGFLCAFEIPIPGSPTSASSPVQTDVSTGPPANGAPNVMMNGDLPKPTLIPNGMPNTVVPCGTERNLANWTLNGHVPVLSDSPCTGYIIAVHRKMMRTELYFLSSQKNRPSLFGMPLIVPCTVHTRKRDLYDAVWIQVSRLASPLPPQEASNHAQDCDDSMGYQYPFTLRVVQKDGNSCAWCPWYRFCRGCKIECTEDRACVGNAYIAVDWDPTALHLRYQTSQERIVEEHESVEQSRRAQAEPINLDSCLRAFTSEEELGEDEMYYCSKCKTHCLATKKLDLWRLPPILIIHLKRFQFVNGRWIKSQKIVKFPRENFDPSAFLVQRDPSQFQRKQLTLQVDSLPELRTLQGESRKADLQITYPPGEGDTLNRSPSSLNTTVLNNIKASPSLGRKSGASCPSSKNSSPNSSPRTLGRGKGRLRLPQLGKNKLSSSKENLDASKENGTDQEQRFTSNQGDALTRGQILGGSQSELYTAQDNEMTLANGYICEQNAYSNGSINGQIDNHSEDDITDDQREEVCVNPIYNLYAISCHSGIMGGGHYVTYAKNPNNKWYCYNDSSCKELHPDEIDTDSAYILFYEQQGVDYAQFLPKIDGKKMADTSSMDEDFESDYKKYCVLQ
ncbi:ubiquitin carboxyl-terminal hydrolase 32 isoform X2 [Falco biarmicus]|uniref:ubiquitin carboxyl-terminal hydrolase 32 isoform X1 n=1 Tax=Falco rusticolus TaxID=120794 RepID=UPI0018867EF9|nr:ubiquitin carboxyl-terminal hydrolase 32 isoform X1 [Falco rusticolus]XP_055575777.1 ubiquitin carboxyl-terminal hydrolase 32 isoform X2 [Falco cherrug]XP_056193496.1 ubiquitin carboxyl-terminal hydrolase 32 isoform X2 [Falco biarmicus]